MSETFEIYLEEDPTYWRMVDSETGEVTEGGMKKDPWDPAGYIASKALVGKNRTYWHTLITEEQLVYREANGLPCLTIGDIPPGWFKKNQLSADHVFPGRRGVKDHKRNHIVTGNGNIIELPDRP